MRLLQHFVADYVEFDTVRAGDVQQDESGSEATDDIGISWHPAKRDFQALENCSCPWMNRQ